MTTAREDAAFISAVISNTLLEDAIDWINMQLEPEDVFSQSKLESWAEDNGFVQLED